ncbi:hypothetical protein LSAT2_032267 [Lamellibrachia satsuma]|nr:hypothetical protein LSAT2_032267 [Lamellibrachia satsuma]
MQRSNEIKETTNFHTSTMTLSYQDFIVEVQTMAQKKKPAVLLVFLDICRKESTTIQKDEQVPPYQPDVAGNSCTFFSASFGQECFEPPPVKQDETVIPYLANDVMCTSIFSRYLLPVIGAKQSIPDVFKHLMDAIHTSDDYYKAYENPEMHINMIEHGRSLADPIYDDDLLAFSQRTELLNEMHQLPLTRNIELTLPDQMIPILLRYEYFFTNVLCMHVIPPLDKLDCDLQLKVKFVDGSIPVVIEPVEIHKVCEAPQRVLVVFKNLQKLACRLKPCLQLGLTVQLRKILIPELDLGWPLVSQLQQQEQEARPAPHKEATQHDENH